MAWNAYTCLFHMTNYCTFVGDIVGELVEESVGGFVADTFEHLIGALVGRLECPHMPLPHVPGEPNPSQRNALVQV